jgi:YesN/AraC family two-component response regulator
MRRVLLVEDEEVIRKGLRKMLEDVIGGCKVVGESGNGKDALELLEMTNPDLVITDIRMDGMNGLELIKRIRAAWRDIDIIIISGYADFEYAQRAIKYGVSDYLLKPIDRVELTLCLDQLNKKRDGQTSREENQEDSEDSQGRRIIRKVKDMVLERLDQDISLQAIAEQVHLNHQYLSALFKTETGQNFSEYVTQCRMDKAKQLLRDTNLKVYEIASLSGYASSKHFMAVFKQIVGVTPSEYRENPGKY